jgi:hypothetical protein
MSGQLENPGWFLGNGSSLTNTALLLKERRLSGYLLRLEKVAQADANQAKPLLRAEADTF